MEESVLIKHVAGNFLSLAIPLTIKIKTEEGGTVVETEEDFYPDPNFPVVVDLYNGYGKHKIFAATMDANVAYIEDNGELQHGMYSVEITCVGTDGHPYRYKAKDVLQVVDLTKDSGLEKDIEYDARMKTLDGSIFIAFTGSFEQEQADWYQGDSTAKSYIKNKPVNVSAFTNDVGYLTEHQDISGKENRISIVHISNGTASLMADNGKCYTANDVNTLSITLPSTTGNYVQSIMFFFITGRTPDVNFVSNGNNVYFPVGYKIEADKTYAIKAQWNGLAWVVYLTEVKGN